MRRNDLSLMTPAEKAIHDAIVEVEKVGAHPTLTDIVLKLSNAKDELSDYIETIPTANAFDATAGDPVPPDPTHPKP